MKKLNDEEIQKLLEGGLTDAGSEFSAHEKEDIKTYKFLFEKLAEEPQEGLPYNFAAKVSRRIQVNVNRADNIRLYLLAAVIGVAGFFIAYVVLVFYNRNVATQFFAAVSAYKWAFALALISFLSIQYLDQKLVKEHQ